MTAQTKTLVVVESPMKAKTLEKYLGPGYIVKASVGHVRDLPKNKLGVDVDHNFEMELQLTERASKTIPELRAAYKKAGDIVLATDYDREGEAIAYDVAEELGVDPRTAKRVTFTEITKAAILQAFEEPRGIDLDLVAAQRARRSLDRIVAYPLMREILWKRVRPRLGAGRVQSVAVRMIVDREREVLAFIPQEYWSVDIRLTPKAPADEQPFTAKLSVIPAGKLAANPDKKGEILGNETDTLTHVERLRQAGYKVLDVTRKEVKRNPSAPFTTSTLQQEAARKLGFSARKTMTLAQRLYEGQEVRGEGTVGLITYMRTDSINIGESALAEIREVIQEKYGDAYTLAEPRRYKKKQRGAQEAHEAIRPTSAMRLPDQLATTLEHDQLRLYRLIWQRTVASQMAEARFNQMGVDIEGAAPDGVIYQLRATGQTLLFDGFRRVYFEGRDDGPDEDAESMLPDMTPEQLLKLVEVVPEQHFTQPPPRYSEASLVKALEEHGIGRPSTYANIIEKIQKEYVRVEEKRFMPEDVALIVTDKLIDHFPDVVDLTFTARMEDQLDEVAEGNLTMVTVLDEFWGPFSRALEKAEYEFERFEEKLEEKCPKCPDEGREPGNLIVKLGKFGKFIGCDKYPDCKYIRNMDGSVRPEPELLDELCPECGKQLMLRTGRFGPFTGCSGYPDCKYIKPDPTKSTGVTCPLCTQGEIIEKRSRFGSTFYGCDRYPDCDLTVSAIPIKDHPCPECGSVLLLRPKKGPRCWNCGCETDEFFTITKPGDLEAEAEVRAAKAVAKAARAAIKTEKAERIKAEKAAVKAAQKKAKPPAKRKTTAKKSTAKRKTTAKKSTAKGKTGSPAPKAAAAPTEGASAGSAVETAQGD